MILVDTSVWVDHLRSDDHRLADLLYAGRVLVHPFVIGELACGNLRGRTEILARLAYLPRAPEATNAEALQFIELRSLMGGGIGFIDVHLLASVALEPGIRLWTRDRRLAGIARELNLGFDIDLL